MRLWRELALVTLLCTAAACSSPNNPDTTPQDATTADVGGSCGAGLGPCDPVANTGCMAGQSCVIGQTMAGMVTTSCVAAGTGAVGTRCVTTDGCAAGLSCLNNVCTQMCCGPGDDARCGGTSRCNQSVTIGTAMAFLCRAPVMCDWFAQDCPNGDNCVATSRTETACEPAGMAGVDQPCGGAMACVRGTFCVTNAMGGGSSCRLICDPLVFPGEDGGTVPDGGAGRACPMNYRCSPLNDRPTNFGGCIPM